MKYHIYIKSLCVQSCRENVQFLTPLIFITYTICRDIAIRDYSEYANNLDKQGTEVKSLTPTVYEAIGDVFRKRFGPKAGWAHSGTSTY